MANDLNLVSAQAMFKQSFGKITHTYNDKTPLLALIKKNLKANWSGDSFQELLVLDTYAGVGARGNGDPVPASATLPMVRTNMLSKKLYATVGYDREAMITSNGPDAFIKATALQTEMAMLSFNMHNLERPFFGDSTGQLGEITVGSVSGTGTEASPWVFTLAVAPVNVSSLSPKRSYFTVNQRLELFSFAGLYQMTLLVRGVTTNSTTKAVTITAVTLSTGSSNSPALTDGVATTAGNVNIVYWDKNRNKEITGLLNVCPAVPGTLYGLSQTLYPNLRGNFQTVAGSIGSTDINNMVELIAEVSGDTPDIAIVSNAKYAELKNALEDAKMYNMAEVKSTNGKIGFSGLNIATDSGELKILKSQFCPEKEMFFLNTEYMQLIVKQDFTWFSEDGNTLSRNGITDQYESRFGGYGDLFIKKPIAFGRLKEV